MPSAALPPPSPRRSRRNGYWLLIKALLIIVLIFVLAAVAYAGYMLVQMNNAINEAGADNTMPVTKPVYDNPVTILLLGTDTRPENPSMNTDVIMVATLNPHKKTATIVSIPRDTIIQLPGYSQAKANSYFAAFHRSSAKTADANIKTLFGKYMNVPIDYVAKVDFKGFSDIVDQLGGLNIDVDMNMCYTDKQDGTAIRLTKGMQLLNGGKTLDFVRYRKGNCQNAADSNDIERNERQQQVIGEIVGKLKSLEGLLKLGAVTEAAGKNVDTDMPSSQIKSLIRTYMSLNRDSIIYVHLEGEWRSPYIYVGSAELKKAQLALQNQLQ